MTTALLYITAWLISVFVFVFVGNYLYTLLQIPQFWELLRQEIKNLLGKIK